MISKLVAAREAAGTRLDTSSCKLRETVPQSWYNRLTFTFNQMLRFTTNVDVEYDKPEWLYYKSQLVVQWGWGLASGGDGRPWTWNKVTPKASIEYEKRERE